MKKGGDAGHEPAIGRRARRHVPFLPRLTMLFGGGAAAVGWFLLAFVGIHTVLFVPRNDILSPVVAVARVVGLTEVAEAKVRRRERTGITVGGGDSRPGRPLYEVESYFRTPNGRIHGGTYYTMSGGRLVRYVRWLPGISAIEGGGMTMQAILGPLFMAAFWGVGLFMVVPTFRRGLAGGRLLRMGELAEARLVSKEATNTQINEQTVYRLRFAYEVPGWGTGTLEVDTHETARLLDDAREPMLYDPVDPGDAILLDSLPSPVRVDPVTDEVDIVGGHFLGVLVCPAIAAVEYGWTAALLLTRLAAFLVDLA